jgi:uncharacterized protein (TIGR03083 family)
MEPIGANNLSPVLEALGPERAALLDLLRNLDDAQWDLPTECPTYPIKGIAAHILGDDLSLLSRQRDGATQGLILVAEKMPGVDFRTLLNAFNDQWVEAARFMSPPVLLELLRLSGEWSAAYYHDVDPGSPGEPVPLFSPAPGESSPFWQAIAREYLERLAHHGQIRRALGKPSLEDDGLLNVAIQVVATAAEMPPVLPTGDKEAAAIGPIVLGPAAQAADILTLAHTEDELLNLLDGPAELVAQFAARVARRTED